MLKEAGFNLTLEPEGDLLLAIDHNRSGYQNFIKAGGEAKQTLLLRLEPRTIFPSQYTKSVDSKYNRIISPGKVSDDPDIPLEIGWPYEYHADPNYPKLKSAMLNEIIRETSRAKLFELEHWLSRPIHVCLIASNKVSPVSDDNYSLRRRIARELEGDLLEIYGQLWNDSLLKKCRHRLAVAIFAIKQGTFPSVKSIYGELFRSYPNAKGSIENKHLVLVESKFSIVVENSMENVTEKIIDVLVNGAIPIYVGPGLRHIGFPDGIAIQSSGEPEEIRKILNDTPTEQVALLLKKAHDFIQSPIFFENWSEEAVYKQILAIVKLQDRN